MRKYETRIGHRVWASLERYELKRDWASHELRHVLPVETGVVHAFCARDTANRDPELFLRGRGIRHLRPSREGPTPGQLPER